MAIQSVLVANRGEIARRIMRTCRAMGIRTIAVFSDADARAPHVAEADTAVRIGPAPSGQSYLRIDAIIDAAKKTGADAIHPGYGFLAENAAFAEAVAEAGLVFVGPSAEVISKMGSKREAKALAEGAGVPVIPGYSGEDQSDATLTDQVNTVGYPALIKASAGGGGKGMRVVRGAPEVAEAIERARSEARSAFGDDTLLIERYIEQPRHVEIQILGDAHGHLVHLFERECSIQRRHQKIIEESPSPALDVELRERMGAAAVAVGAAIGYQNAGTVEFILAPDGEFYFLEVNTRLQVEHPVTECVTGVDLVREQIRVAEGHPLGFSQSELRQTGSAIECRIYAEDPARNFLPASGTLVDWSAPDGARVDSGVEPGSEIGIHYDPMLAKVITHGADRAEAIRKMVRALSRLHAPGITTNRELLIGVLEHPEFTAGQTDTHFLDRHMSMIEADVPVVTAAIAVTLAQHATRAAERTLSGVPSGWRNNRFADQWVEHEVDGETIRVEYRVEGSQVELRVGEDSHEVASVQWAPPALSFEVDGVRRTARLVFGAERFYCLIDGAHVVGRTLPRFPEQEVAEVEGGCIAPMPAKVLELRTEAGAAVERGQVLAVLEAMKMEHTVTAPFDGTVEKVLVAVGEQVDEGALLVVVQEVEDGDG